MGRHTHPFVNTAATEDAWITYIIGRIWLYDRTLLQRMLGDAIQAAMCPGTSSFVVQKRKTGIWGGSSALPVMGKKSTVGEKEPTVKYISKAGECGTQ